MLKMIFYIKNIFCMAFVNKTRFVLTSIGIFVSVLLFSVANIITNSYYSLQFNSAEEMRDNGIIVSSYGADSISKIKGIMGEADLDILRKEVPEQIFSSEIEKGQYLNVRSYINGISSMRNGIPITLGSGGVIVAATSLIKGRMIDERDSTEGNQVVVIDEYTEKMLFPDENALGQKISFMSSASGGNIGVSGSTYDMSDYSYEVIGVIKASQAAKERYLELKEKVSSETKDQIIFYVDLYIPASSLDKLADGSTIVASAYQICESEAVYSYQKELINKKISIELDTENNYLVSTKETIIENITSELQNTKTIIDMGMLVLCILSGISIMGITFFAVKERIPEIGTRKAFGAGKIDIMFQMMLEMMIIAVCSSLFAVASSRMLCELVCNLLLAKYYIYIPVLFGFKEFALPVIIGVLIMCFSSLIPAYYAATIKVTDALRHE